MRRLTLISSPQEGRAEDVWSLLQKREDVKAWLSLRRKSDSETDSEEVEVVRSEQVQIRRTTQNLISQQASRIKALRNERKALKENVLLLEKSRRKEVQRETWSSYYDEEIKEYCKLLRLKIDSWTGEHVIKDINTVDSRLSASEKQTIVASLDGYCKQEDWESLIKRFSAGVR